MHKGVYCLGMLAATLAIVGCGGSGGSGNASGGADTDQTSQAAASFSLSAPTGVTVAPASSQTISIAVAPVNGFLSPVTVTLSGLPAGVNASPASFTLAPAASAEHRVAAEASAEDAVPASSQTVVITANADATPGPVGLVVTATSGALSQTITTSTSQADFALSGPSQPIALAAGGTAQVSLSAAGFNGFSGQVSATLAGLPAGVTASPSTLTLMPGTAQTITLTAADAQPGSSTLTLEGASGALAHNLELPLALSAASITPPAPDFSLSVAPSAITLAAGGSPGQVMLSATAINGFTGAIEVSLNGLPSGVVAMPANFVLTPGTPQQISLTVGAADTAAAATLVLDAQAGTVLHTTELALTITPPQPSFTLQAVPAALTLTAGGGPQPINVTVNPLYGFSGQVNVVLAGLPAGVTASPLALTLTPGVTQTVNLTAGSNAAAGTGALNLLGTSGTISSGASVGLIINTSTPDFVFSATPSTITVIPGTFQPVVLSIVPLSGFNSSVGVTVGSLPDGVIVSPQTEAGNTGTGPLFPVPANILPLAPNVSEVVYVGLPTGDSAPTTIDFQAVAGTLTHNAAVTANPASTTNAASDFYLASSPPALLLYPGEPLPATGTQMEVLGGIFGVNESSPTPTIALTSPLPSGMTSTVTNLTASVGVGVNFTVAPDLVGSSGTLAFQASSGSSSGSMTREVDVPYSVVAAPELTQMLIPSTTFTLPQGSTEDLYVALAGTQQLGSNGAPAAAIVITGLPFGVTNTEPDPPPYLPSVVPEQFSAAPTTAVGQTPVTVTTTANGLTQTSQFTLNVVAIPNFTLTATPTTFDMAAGTTQTFTLEANALNGFTGDVSVNLTVAGNLTVTPLTLTLTPGTPQTISVTAPATGTTPGNNITVQATAGSLSQTLIVPVTVTPPGPDFSVQVPSTITLGDYAVGTFPVISSTLVGGVTEVLTGLPAGVVVGSGPNGDDLYVYGQGPLTLPATCGVASQGPAYPGTNCSYYVYALEYQGAAAGTYPLTLTATYTPNPNSSPAPGSIPGTPTYPITHTYQVSLIVTPPDYSLSVSPTSLTIAPGTSQSFTVTATPLTPGTGSISFGLLSSLPSGVTVTSTSSGTNGGAYTSVFTLSAAAGAPAGSVTLTVEAVSQIPVLPNTPFNDGFGFTHTIQVPLVIGP